MNYFSEDRQQSTKMIWREGLKISLLALLTITISIEAARYDGSDAIGQSYNYYVANGGADDPLLPPLDELLGVAGSNSPSLQEMTATGYLVAQDPGKLSYLVGNADYQPAAAAAAIQSQLDALEAKKLNEFMMDKIQRQARLDENDGGSNFLGNIVELGGVGGNFAGARYQLDDEPISDPVNDPVEFKNEMARSLANSNGSAIIDGLVSTYLNDMIASDEQSKANSGEPSQKKKDKSDAEKESSDKDANNNQEQSVTDALDNELDGGSSTSASRYGNAEYIDHPLALVGHQYVQGGAGEGRQLLGPDGTFENVQVIKTDRAVPSYCDPPNPCPIGYTAEDGCLEEFVNSASFSREYQAKQHCSCDNEHSLFNCASPVSTIKNEQLYSSNEPAVEEDELSHHHAGNDQTESSNDQDNNNNINNDDDQDEHHHGSKLDTLARTIQNRFGDLDSVRNLIAIGRQQDDSPNGQVLISRVAKKAPRVESDFRY